MMNKKVCAYIDILGFENIIKLDLEGACRLLSDYYNILHMKVTDERLFKAYYDTEEKSAKLKSVFNKSILDSFEYFIPFSDAAFIISDKPSAFVFQISNFLLESFMLGGYIYDDAHLQRRNDLLIIDDQRKVKWYPLLFRGGVSFNECLPVQISQIVKSQLRENYNAIGKAVLEAVQLERLDKGPRLFCTKEFFDSLSDEESRQIILFNGTQNMYEILWPMPYIQRHGVNEYRRLLEISLNLWQYFVDEEFGIQYFKFVELVIGSILELYKNNKHELHKIRHNITKTLKKKNINISEFRRLFNRYGI